MKPTLLCLHGWGGSKDSFMQLHDALSDSDIEFLAPDLPGFGAEPDPPTPWTVDDYASWVKQWLSRNRREQGPLWILGHSHGGRIAIKCAAEKTMRIDRLFLCAPAINRKHRFVFRRTFGVAIAKAGHGVLSLPGLSPLKPFMRKVLYKILGVHDYERADPLMQQTLVLVTKEDLSTLLPSVTIPVDLFWGTEDAQTPVSDGYYMKNVLPHCVFHVFAGTRHAVHKTNAREIAAVIRQRLDSLR